jgi:hypothetical protein
MNTRGSEDRRRRNRKGDVAVVYLEFQVSSSPREIIERWGGIRRFKLKDTKKGEDKGEWTAS